VGHTSFDLPERRDRHVGKRETFRGTIGIKGAEGEGVEQCVRRAIWGVRTGDKWRS